MTKANNPVNMTTETSHTTRGVMQRQRRATPHFELKGPWRQCFWFVFSFPIADAINPNGHRKAVSVSRGFFYVSLDIPAVSTKPNRAKQK